MTDYDGQTRGREPLPLPPPGLGGYLDYSSAEDGLAGVVRVMPAWRCGTWVATDHHDGYDHVAEAIDRHGSLVHLVICRAGWLPLVPYVEPGRNPKWSRGRFTTVVPARLQGLRLSNRDRRHIARAVLATYLGSLCDETIDAWLPITERHDNDKNNAK